MMDMGWSEDIMANWKHMFNPAAQRNRRFWVRSPTGNNHWTLATDTGIEPYAKLYANLQHLSIPAVEVCQEWTDWSFLLCCNTHIEVKQMCSIAASITWITKKAGFGFRSYRLAGFQSESDCIRFLYISHFTLLCIDIVEGPRVYGPFWILSSRQIGRIVKPYRKAWFQSIEPSKLARFNPQLIIESMIHQ